MDRIFALVSAAMFIVMLSSVALFLMIVDAGARQIMPVPSAPLILVGPTDMVRPALAPTTGSIDTAQDISH